MNAPRVVVVGNVTIDDVIYADGAPAETLHELADLVSAAKPAG